MVMTPLTLMVTESRSVACTAVRKACPVPRKFVNPRSFSAVTVSLNVQVTSRLVRVQDPISVGVPSTGTVSGLVSPSPRAAKWSPRPMVKDLPASGSPAQEKLRRAEDQRARPPSMASPERSILVRFRSETVTLARSESPSAAAEPTGRRARARAMKKAVATTFRVAFLGVLM